MGAFTENFMELIHGIKTNRYRNHIYAVLILAVVGLFVTYFFIFRYPNDPDRLAKAIASEIRVDVSVIGIEKTDEDLYVFYKINGVGSSCEVGFAWYKLGITGQYRYLGTKRQIIPYESIVMIWPRDDVRGSEYYVGGYNCGAIDEFGIEIRDLNTYDLYSVKKFQVPSDNFVMTVDEASLMSGYSPSEGEEPVVWLLPAYYDETGADITETLRVESETSRSLSRFPNHWTVMIFTVIGVMGAAVAIILPLILAGEMYREENK